MRPAGPRSSLRTEARVSSVRAQTPAADEQRQRGAALRRLLLRARRDNANVPPATARDECWTRAVYDLAA